MSHSCPVASSAAAGSGPFSRYNLWNVVEWTLSYDSDVAYWSCQSKCVSKVQRLEHHLSTHATCHTPPRSKTDNRQKLVTSFQSFTSDCGGAVERQSDKGNKPLFSSQDEDDKSRCH